MSFWRRDYLLPVALVVFGAYLLLRNLNLLDWLDGRYVWPVILILLGVWLIVGRRRA